MVCMSGVCIAYCALYSSTHTAPSLQLSSASVPRITAYMLASIGSRRSFPPSLVPGLPMQGRGAVKPNPNTLIPRARHQLSVDGPFAPPSPKSGCRRRQVSIASNKQASVVVLPPSYSFSQWITYSKNNQLPRFFHFVRTTWH